MKTLHISKVIVILMGSVLLSTDSFAFRWFRSQQSPPPTSYQMPRLSVPQGSTSAPFDGGLSLMIAAGVAYASKKGFDKRKKIKEAENQ
ncbi:MAG: hypothetical protein JWR18_836 [Segetibacter sp.]|nr:hypothetical protein [Segetibacter sp.]